MKAKRVWATVLAAAMVLAAAGCGKQSEETAAGTETGKEDYVYAAEYYPFAAEGYAVSSVMLGEQETAYLAGTKENTSGLFSMKAGDGVVTKVPVELEENTLISAMGKDGEGNLLLGIMKFDSLGDENAVLEGVEIRTVGTDGRTLESVDTENTFLNVPDFYIQNMVTDKEGNYYICANQTIYVLHPDGKLYGEIQAEDYISSMFSLKGEKTVAAYYGNTGWKMQEVDPVGKALKDIPSKTAFDYGTYQAGTDTDLLYTQGTTLYTCNLADEKPTRILDWVESDIDSNNLKDFRMLEDGRVLALSLDYGSEMGKAELAVLTKKNRSEVPEKTVITYGALFMNSYTNEDIVAFNKQSDKYRVEIKMYGDDQTDFETKTSLFTADLATGQGPDIIDLFYIPISCKELAEMGVAEDLNPYLENDPELNREDYIENVMKAYEVDGKLYGIMPGFGIRTLVGKVSDVGEGETWTVDDLISLVDSKAPDAEIIPYSSKSSILQLMCSTNEDLFVNDETGECSFTGEAFAKILEFANQFPSEMNWDANAPSDTDRIRSGQLILTDATITSVQLYQMYEVMFGEPVNFIGYPTVQDSGSILEPYGTTAAMNVNSKNKEGVWEFLRFNLTKEKQENFEMGNPAFPIMKSALDKMLAEDMEPEYYEDADGNKKEKPKGTWGNGDVTTEVFAATPEQAEHVKNMIHTAKSGKQSDTKLFEIINEEAQAYFEGQKSAEDVAALIQNRAQTYINESR